MPFITEYIGFKRYEMRISQEKLSSGLCFHTILNKIESNKIYCEKFLIDAILQRLNVEKDEFEHYVTKEDYFLQMLRFDILSSVRNSLFDDARKLIQKYINSADMSNSLHVQFSKYANLIIEANINPFAPQLPQLYKEVIHETVVEFEEKNLNELLLSDIEIYLVFKYIEALRSIDDKTWLKSALELLNFKKKNMLYCMINARILLFVAQEFIKEKRYMEILELIDNTLELSRYLTSYYYFTDLINLKIKILTLIERKNDEYEKLVEWHNCLTQFFNDFEIDINDIFALENQAFLWKNYYVLNEVIKNRRLMLGMSQYELSDGICDVKTISRIENNRTTPHPNTASKLLEKLNLTGDLYSDNVKFKDMKTFKLCVETTDLMSINDFVKTKNNIDILKTKLTMSNKINKQYVRHKEINLEFILKKLNSEEIVDELISCLEVTIPAKNMFCNKKKHLTKKEIILISNIVDSLSQIEQFENTKNWSKILEDYFYDDSVIKKSFSNYAFSFHTIASTLGNMGDFQKSNMIACEVIKKSFESFSFRQLNYLLYELAYNFGCEIGQISNRVEKKVISDADKHKYIKLLNTAYVFSEIKKEEYMLKLILKKMDMLN